ncbi:uncharacterized protein LOC122332366 [Puntigrus tetrazona]|uniref:uncharacterized protein LOC122332366 n=1 Tax=Puntigrus tetrazona TaxID=1606681 RepID=UPI001C89A9BA|nr:uncharacterized protein LOC122332366 [Puntigrus tetrazona]
MFIPSLDVSGVDTEGQSVFVLEGDSVTLHTDVKLNRQDRMKWYFNDTRIAQIKGDFDKVCTDVKCDEKFRDRLKLDKTGSLTITDIKTTDSGVYKLQTIRKGIGPKIFHVAVHGVSAAKQEEMNRKAVKEGETLVLDPGEIKNNNYLITWHFNDDHIAEITGDQIKICTDVQCEPDKERFRGRLKVNHVSGSLTITDTRITDSGRYKLKIVHSIRHRHSISIIRIRRFSVTVIDIYNFTGPSSGLIAGICAAVVVVLLVFTTVTCRFCCCRR